MSGTIQGMKDAVKGENTSGLQSISNTAGELLAGNTDTRGSQGKKSDEAASSLKDYAKGGSKSGQTVEGTSVKASDQVANTQTGSADHLELGMRKET